MVSTSTKHFKGLSPDDKRRVVETLQKSIVAVSWATVLTEPVSQDGRIHERFGLRPHYESGFLVVLDDPKVLAVVTAGHILKQLEDLDGPGRRLVSLRIMDRGPAPDDNAGVPLRHDLVIRASPYSADGDMDCGALIVPAFEAATIQAGGVVGHIPSRLVADPSETFDAYFLLGFPASARVDSGFQPVGDITHFELSVGCPMLEVTPVSVDGYDVTGRTRFSARIDNPDQPGLRDIAGMSGGPVWGIRGTGAGLEIRLVGIQSCWLPKSKVIFAEYAKPFLGALSHGVREVFDQLSKGHTSRANQSSASHE